MRNTGTRGYNGYRGRRPDGKRWLILALALLLLAGVAFLVAQRYMVYNMDGSYYFELPWSRRANRTEQTALSGSRQDLEIVIEGASDSEDAPVVTQPLHAQELDAATLQGGMTRALDALPDNINAAAIRLKTPDGDLLYPSSLSAAVEAKAVAGGSIARSAIAELNDSGCYTIARLSALHDSRYSYAHKVDAAVQQVAYSGEIWYDPDSTFYLAPEKELARQYLVSIAAEVASLGFDEILFDEFTYPPAGRLNNIRTGDRTMTMDEALALLADELRAGLEDYDVRLSVSLDADTVLAGSNEKTGQVLSDLASRFDRVYVPTTEEQIPALEAALAPYSAALVPVLTAAPAAEGAYLIASDG